MFADDMAIFSETREGLQAGLDALSDYCRKWGLTVNIDKTKIVVFRKGWRLGRLDRWMFRGKILEVVSVFKYLGFYISSTGSHCRGIRELITTARRALFGLKKRMAKYPELIPSMQLELFQRTVQPILLYVCEIWGYSEFDQLERFFLSFLKNILFVKKSTPNCFVYGELGVFPLYIEQRLRVIKYWLKLIRPSYSMCSYTKLIYREMLNLNTTHPNSSTWVTHVKNMLDNCGMGNFWKDQVVDDEFVFISLFKQRMYDIYQQEWMAEVNSTSDYRLFKHLKENFCFEEYLNIFNKPIRIALTKLRLSSHLFHVERGRWYARKLDIKDRLCSLCNVIEDEFHCLIECPRYSSARVGNLPNYLKKKPSMYKFINALKCDEPEICQKLGILCLKIMREHRKFI